MKDKEPVINQFLFQAKYIEDAKKYLTEEQLKEFCYGIVMNGLYGERYESKEYPMMGMALEQIYSQTETMNAGYKEAVENGRKSGGRNKKYSHELIAELKKQGKTVKEIAEQLGCSTSTIYKSKGWKEKEESSSVFEF